MRDKGKNEAWVSGGRGYEGEGGGGTMEMLQAFKVKKSTCLKSTPNFYTYYNQLDTQPRPLRNWGL